MKPALLAFVSGCAATAAVAWAIGEVRADNAIEPVLHVCAAPDGVLRLVASSLPCPPGQRRLLLRKAESDADAPDAADEPASKTGAADDKQVAALEKRVDALEKQGSEEGDIGGHATIPFRIKDDHGRTVLLVDANESGGFLQLRDPAVGKTMIIARAGPDGGYFWAMNATRNLGAGLIAMGTKADMRVVDMAYGDVPDKVRVTLGHSDAGGNYRLKFMSAAGNAVAEMGELAQAPTGAVAISDAKGVRRIMMSVQEEKQRGFVGVLNGSGTQLVSILTQGANGGGLLNIYGPRGEPMVEAGVVAEGFGVVRAGPEGFKPGLGLLGLPGSYIAGKAN